MAVRSFLREKRTKRKTDAVVSDNSISIVVNKADK